MTHFPTRSEFRSLARKWRIVPVWREVLADLTTPVAAYCRVVGDAQGFLLESVDHHGQWSRWSFVGRNPIATLISHGKNVRVVGELGIDVPLDKGILAALDVVVDYYHVPPIDGLPPLHSGLVGYLGHDIVREVEYLPEMPPDDLGYPDAVMSIIGDVAAYDHALQKAILISNVMIPHSEAGAPDDSVLDELYDEGIACVDAIAADGARPLHEPVLTPIAKSTDVDDSGNGDNSVSSEADAHVNSSNTTAVKDNLEDLQDLGVTSTFGVKLYSQAVEAAKEYMRAGDIFQVVLSQRFSFDLKAEVFNVYRALRQVNPSPYMYYLRLTDLEVVGGSPEPMVKLVDGKLTTWPTAGSRWRGRTEEEDERLEAELLEDPKDLAEHVMLVDLQRNDLGRVVEFGTLDVPNLMVIKKFSHVMHIASEVTGRLATQSSVVDALRATLPAGTVSGAPKVRALEIIDELEPLKRVPPYAGLVGYLDFSGNMDTALSIRTMTVRRGRASVQAGAGLVVDSVPELEHNECVNKATALMVAARAARNLKKPFVIQDS